MDEIFPGIPKIKYEGPDSKNPLAFKYFDSSCQLGDKTMIEHLRFSMVFWHTFNGGGNDPFGTATAQRPWDGIGNPMQVAEMKMRGLFELTDKLGIPFFCFHDRDIAPEGRSLRDSNKNLDKVVSLVKELYQDYPTRLLWGTAQLFFQPRYMHGAATSPYPDVFAYAAAQVKKAMEVTHELGGLNYVFWGGREGYETLLNTDMQLELDNLGIFLNLAADYAEKIRFKGQLLIEPKPREPTKHQYDSDAAAIWGFLQEYGLEKKFKLNIETNHATLAGHSMEHELQFARSKGILGSIDANQGDELLGWDTDQFPTNLYTTTAIMRQVILNGGLHSGGLNFDARVRRPSYTVEDLAIAHIAGMDAFARGLLTANSMINDGIIDEFVTERYSGYRQELGKRIREKSITMEELETHILDKTEIMVESGRQEQLESIINSFL